MALTFQTDKDRIYAQDENGQTLAEIVFPYRSQRTVEITHTFVSPSLRGQGIAETLVRAVADALKEKNIRVVATCPYAAKWFEKNPSYAHLLAD